MSGEDEERFQSTNKFWICDKLFDAGYSKHSFCIVFGKLPKIMWKLCLSAKFPHQEIRWNYVILHCESKKSLLYDSSCNI